MAESKLGLRGFKSLRFYVVESVDYFHVRWVCGTRVRAHARVQALLSWGENISSVCLSSISFICAVGRFVRFPEDTRVWQESRAQTKLLLVRPA